MSYQFYNNWPYSYSYFPTMLDHIDPVNNTYFTGLHTEINNIENAIGLNFRGGYPTLEERLLNINTDPTMKFFTKVVGFTADCDYRADILGHREAIQQAITDISVSGGTIVIREGTYNIDGNINLYSNIDIIGNGFNTIIRREGDATSTIFLISGINNVSIRHLCIDGNRSGCSNPSTEIQINTSSNIIIFDCLFISCIQVALHIATSSLVRITNNIFYDNIVDSIFIHTYTSSVFNKIIISGNVFYDGTTGIHIDNDTYALTGCIFNDNYFNNMSKVIYCENMNCVNVSVKDNIFAFTPIITDGYAGGFLFYNNIYNGPTSFVYQSYLHTYVSTNQSISTGVSTIIHFNIEVADYLNEFDNSSTYLFTAKYPGLYLITAPITMLTAAAGTLEVKLKKNGTEVCNAYAKLSSAGSVTATTCCVLSLAVGDTIGIYALQDSGGSVSLNGGDDTTVLTIKRI